MKYMYELDIPCVIVTNEDWSHAWNKVYTGDRWLHVDVCWSDTGYGSRTILKTDKEIVALGQQAGILGHSMTEMKAPC